MAGPASDAWAQRSDAVQPLSQLAGSGLGMTHFPPVEDLVAPGFHLVDLPERSQGPFVQALVHTALRRHPGKVLVYDAGHAFSPDAYAAENRRRGRPEAEHAHRCLVQRCITPFQWDTLLWKHLDRFLAANTSPARPATRTAPPDTDTAPAASQAQDPGPRTAGARTAGSERLSFAAAGRPPTPGAAPHAALPGSTPPGGVALVVAFPYGRLFATDELAPWERVDHLEFSLAHLPEAAARHDVPIVALCDLAHLADQPDLHGRMHAAMQGLDRAASPMQRVEVPPAG